MPNDDIVVLCHSMYNHIQVLSFQTDSQTQF